MWRPALLLVSVGCSGVFGLDETSPASADGDHDGVVETEDNCPGLANPEQVDSDSDELGDACDPTPFGLACPAGVATGADVDRDLIDDGCDPCLLGPPHDEDADGVADACDNCPGTPNPDQAQFKDTDGIGDACDLGLGAQERIVFDPFVGSFKTGAWESSTWVVGADHVTSGAGSLRLASSQGTLRASPTPTWSVETVFELTADSAELVGIELQNIGGTIFCGVRYVRQTDRFELAVIGVDGATVTAPIPATPARIRVYAEVPLGVSVTCEHQNGTRVQLDNAMFGAEALRPALYSKLATRFFHAEVIR